MFGLNYQIFTGGEDDKWEGGEDGGEGSRDPERRGLGRSGEVRETRGTPGEMESNRTTISRPLARSNGWQWLSFLCSLFIFRILERLHSLHPAENTYVSLTSDSLYTSLQVYIISHPCKYNTYSITHLCKYDISPFSENSELQNILGCFLTDF